MNMTIKPDSFIEGRGGMMGGKGGGGGDSPANSIRSNAVADIVDLLGEGPIKGLVNGARSIFLNETPLKARNGKWNFRGVTWDMRRGGLDNENNPMKGNNRIETPVDVQVEVTKNGGGVIRTVTNPLVDAVRLIVRIPALYKYDKKDGKMGKTNLKYRIFTRRPAGSGAWNMVVDQEFAQEKTSSPYQKAHYFDLPDGTGDCEIRFERLTDDSTDEKLANETWWDSHFEIIKGKFIYPHSAFIRMTMNAEKVGSSIPQRAAEVYGLIVKVPTNYDPDTRTYSGIWDGTFKNAWTDNPAWIFYDILTTRRYGMGEFVAENQVDKWSLYTIAKHCDEKVDTGFKNDAGNKIKEPRYTFNGVLQNREEAFTVLKQIAATWRGMVYWSLGQIFATTDTAVDPVNIMTPANVINGEFSYSGTALKATHSVVLVTWNDPDDFYKPATEVVINEEMLKKYGWREKTLQLTGCTSRSMAHRYGRWILDTEQYETETVEYTAGLDNMNMRPGDIIGIADPMKAQVRAGGRLRANATAQYALLDQPFIPVAGQTYKIMMTRPSGAVSQLPNGNNVTSLTGEIVTKTVQSFGEGDAVNGYKRVNFAGGDLTGNLPNKNSMFAITGDVQLRKYRVLSVREEAKHQFRVTALFHDPNKFARVERNVELEPIQYTRHEKYVDPATDLRIREIHYLNDNNQLRSTIHVSWSPSADPLTKDYRVVYLHPDKGRINLGYFDTCNVDITDVEPGEYTVKVFTRAHTGMLSDELSSTFTVEGASKIPAPIVGDLALGDRNGTTFLGADPEITWTNKFARTSDEDADDYVHIDDFSPLYAYTRVKVYDVASGDLLRNFKTKQDSYTYTLRTNKQDNKSATPSRGPSRSIKFDVSITDRLGRESAVETITVNNPAPPAPTFSVTQRGTVMQVNINAVDADDIEGYCVWMSQSPGFTPGAGNLVYDGNGRHPEIDVQRGKTYYVICAAYDRFGKSLLNYSAQLATSANNTVSDGQAPNTPNGLSATSVGDTDGQGHVRGMIKFNWNDNSESFFDHYEIEIQEEGADYTSLKKHTSKHSFRAKIGNTYRFRVRACDAQGNKSAWTVWGAANSSVVALGDTVAPEQAVITSAVPKVKGMKLVCQDVVAKDYKRTGYWRYDTLANANADTGAGREFAGWGGETFIDQDNLANNTVYYYRAAHQDRSGNTGPKSATFTSGNTLRIIQDDITDGAVSGAKIASSAVTVDKTDIGDTSNMIADTNCKILSKWTGSAGLSVNATGYLGESSHRMQVSASTAEIFISTLVDMSVKAGRKYDVSVMAGPNNATAGDIEAVIDWYSLDNQGAVTFLSTSSLGLKTAQTSQSEFAGIVTAPSNARRAALKVYKRAGANNADLTIFAPIVRKAIEEAMTDQTAPGQPAAPTLSTYAADIDGDGTVDTGLTVSVTQPSGVKVVEYEIERHASGTVGGTYVLRGERLKFAAEDPNTAGTVTTFSFRANQAKFWKVRARAIAFNGKKGAWSNLTTTGLQPSAYSATLTASAPGAVQVANGYRVTWTKPTDKAYKESELFADGVSIFKGPATAFTDMTARAIGATPSYTVRHFDKTDNVGTTSSGFTAPAYRAATSAEVGVLGSSNIGDGTVIGSKVVAQDTSNIADNGWATGDISAWNRQNQQAYYNSAIEGDASGWVYQSTGRDQARAVMIAVNPGETFYFDVWVHQTDTTRANLMVQAVTPAGVNSYPVVAFTDTKNAWTRLVGQWTVPAGVTRAAMLLQNERTAGAGTSCYWSRPIMRRVTDNLLISNGAVTDNKTDQTQPNTPTMSMAGYGADFDQDGSLDAGITITVNNPNTGRVLSRYIVEVQRSDDGSTGWANWRRFVFEAEDVADSLQTLYQFPANRRKFYRARVRSVAQNGRKSGWSGYTGNAQPTALTGYTGQTAAQVDVPVVLANGYEITWSLGSLSAEIYKETEVTIAGVVQPRVVGLHMIDMTPRAIGATPVITVRHFDTNGGVTNASPGRNAGAYRAATSAEVGVLASGNLGTGIVGDTNLKAGRGANLLINTNAALGTNYWSIGANTGGPNVLSALPVNHAWAPMGEQCFQVFQNDGITTGYTSIFHRDAFGADRRIPVKAGQRYEFHVLTGSHRCTSRAFIMWYNAAGANLSNTQTDDNAGTHSGGQNLTGYKQIGVFATAPAGAAYAIIMIRKLNTTLSTDTTSFLFFTHAFFGEAGAQQTEYSPWAENGNLLVTRGITDQTALTAPTSLALALNYQDIDGDGAVDTTYKATWAALTNAAGYEVSVERSNDGSTGWTVVETLTSSTVLHVAFKVVTGKYYRARIRAINFAGSQGAWSGYTGNVQPPARAAAPGVVTAVTVTPKAKIMQISWTDPVGATDKEVLGYNVYFNTTNNSGTATKIANQVKTNYYMDGIERAAGTVCYYWIETVSRSGIVSARVAAANNPQNYRLLDSTDVGSGAIKLTQLANPANTSMFLDFNMEDKNFWNFRRYTYAGGPGTAVDIDRATKVTVEDNPLNVGSTGGTNRRFKVDGTTLTDVIVFESAMVPVKKARAYDLEMAFANASAFTLEQAYIEIDYYRWTNSGSTLVLNATSTHSFVDINPPAPTTSGTRRKWLRFDTSDAEAYASYCVFRLIVKPTSTNATNIPSIRVGGFVLTEAVQPEDVTAVSYADSGTFTAKTFGTTETTVAWLGSTSFAISGTGTYPTTFLSKKDGEKTALLFNFRCRNGGANARNYDIKLYSTHYDSNVGNFVDTLLYTIPSYYLRTTDSMAVAAIVNNFVPPTGYGIDWRGFQLKLTPDGNANDIRSIDFTVIEFRQP